MRVGNFSLLIPEGVERESGYVQLQHGTVYTLRLGNNDYSRRCDATVKVDGKEIGVFRVNAGQNLVIERPVNDTGRFTFYRSDSEEAVHAGVANTNLQERGLVQVIFRPEFVKPVQTSKVLRTMGVCGQSSGRTYEPLSFAGCQDSSGITGLTGHSDQQYYNVTSLNYDQMQETTISIRLVVCQQSHVVRELLPVSKGNRVPDPV